MRINSVRPLSFGKIHVTPEAEQKESLYLHAAYGIGEGSVGHFAEKYRLTNLSKRFDIKVDENGANVIDKKTNKTTNFDANENKDYANVLYHTLNAAMNYVLLKDNGTFEPDEPYVYRKKK